MPRPWGCPKPGAGRAASSLPTQPFCRSTSRNSGSLDEGPQQTRRPALTRRQRTAKTRPPIPQVGSTATRTAPARRPAAPASAEVRPRPPAPARRHRPRAADGPRPSRPSRAPPHLSGAAGTPPPVLRPRPPRMRSAAAGSAGRPPRGQGSARGGAGPGRAAHGAAGRAGTGGCGAGRGAARQGGLWAVDGGRRRRRRRRKKRRALLGARALPPPLPLGLGPGLQPRGGARCWREGPLCGAGRGLGMRRGFASFLTRADENERERSELCLSERSLQPDKPGDSSPHLALMLRAFRARTCVFLCLFSCFRYDEPQKWYPRGSGRGCVLLTPADGEVWDRERAQSRFLPLSPASRTAHRAFGSVICGVVVLLRRLSRQRSAVCLLCQQHRPCRIVLLWGLAAVPCLHTFLLSWLGLLHSSPRAHSLRLDAGCAVRGPVRLSSTRLLERMQQEPHVVGFVCLSVQTLAFHVLH